MSAWSLLVAAGVLEMGWAIGLKFAEGFTRLWPSLGTAAAMIASMYLLALAARELPIGTAYAVWTGIGAALGESSAGLRLGCIGLIVIGVVGLKLAGE